MNAPLTYAPAYLGLFASLWLAMVCNSFLDVQNGRFAFEAFFWAAIHGWTLRVAWLQRGKASESGQKKKKIVCLIGFALFVVIFIPIWGLPRAGLYLLSMLQAAQNCVTTSRRQLHLGLLVSAIMVMFSAAHYLADWTMLFYLLPYIIAVVFTLVAEQISRHTERVRESSLKDTGRTGQGIAIATATAIILGLTGLLYILTPQVHWPSLHSQYGQPGHSGGLGESTGDGPGGQGSPSQQGSGSGEWDTGDQSTGGGGWPTPEQMREAAGRPGMPAWQANAIRELADLHEALGDALRPVAQAMSDLLEDLKEWLNKNLASILDFLLALLVVMLLIALLMLLKEAKVGIWIRTHLDHLYLVSMGKHAAGRAGILQFYRAMERLFLLADSPRSELANTREFLRDATYFKDDMRPAATEITLMFERYRYGMDTPTAADLSRMKQLYQQLYRLQHK